MSEQRDRAAALEDRYVSEHDETEEMVEELDPARPREQQSVDEVKAVGNDEDGDDEQVEKMARGDP